MVIPGANKNAIDTAPTRTSSRKGRASLFLLLPRHCFATAVAQTTPQEKPSPQEEEVVRIDYQSGAGRCRRDGRERSACY
jgi:hypothetical protein